MRGPQAKNQRLWARLVAGENPYQLIAEGYPRTTVNRLYDRLQLGKYTGTGDENGGISGLRTPSEPVVGNPSDTVVRITQEEIVLPGEMFILYDFILAQNPEYQVSKAEWLVDVVNCWAEDHALEIGFHPMSWAYWPKPVDEGEDLTAEGHN